MKLSVTAVFALASAASAFPLFSSISLGKRQNTGSCGSPDIVFAAGLDGRKDASFQASNLA